MNEKYLIEDLYDEIKSAGYDVESILSGDVDAPPNIKSKLDQILSQDKSFYSKLLKKFVGEEFQEEEARTLWKEILDHKYVVSEKLGRNVGVRVAALDYLENIKKIIKSSRIIDEEEFIRTLRMATVDSLTGLYNRQYFFDFVRTHMRRDRTLCLAFLDLDGFKKYNDTEGHTAGDLVLQEFAVMVRQKFENENCIVGRYGGDEFVVCMLDVPKHKAYPIFDEFRKEMQEQFLSVKITVSIGLCEYPTDSKDFYDLVAKADELLYRVKEFGGNKVFMLRSVELVFYPEKDQKPKEVSVVGDFNNWDRKQGVMVFVPEENKWVIKLLLKPGNYRYKFLLDTNFWMVDKNAKQFVDDGFGGKCSLLTVLEK